MHFGQAVTNITLYHQMLNFTHWAFKLQVCWHVLSEYFTLLWRNNFPLALGFMCFLGSPRRATSDQQQTLAGYDINRWCHSGLIPPFTEDSPQTHVWRLESDRIFQTAVQFPPAANRGWQKTPVVWRRERYSCTAADSAARSYFFSRNSSFATSWRRRSASPP